MKRLSIALPAIIGLLAGVSQAALAQDAAAGGSWAGPYAGVHVGYGNASDDDFNTTGQAVPNVNNVAGGARPAKVSLSSDGFVGGALVGYNWQSGTMVYGLEADLDYTDVDGSRRVGTLSLPTATPPNAPLNNTFKSSLDYLGTLRVRVGYVMQNTLIYGTGGFAYGKVDNDVRMFGAAGQLQFSGSDDETETGYALGAGIEQDMGNNWAVTAGYMYYDLGSQTTNVAVVAGGGGAGTGYNSKIDTQGHLFRAGVNFGF